MATAISTARVSAEEYLIYERAALEKHEYFNGRIWQVPPASLAHCTITGNLAGEPGNRLRIRSHRVYLSQMRLRCPSGLFTYPDVIVGDGRPEFADEHRDILSNPLILIEVLPPSTEAYDRGKKFDHYMTIESLKEYVLVSQDRSSISHFERQEDGHWLLASITQMEQSLALPTVNVSLPLAEIYDKIEFPPEEALPEGSEMRA